MFILSILIQEFSFPFQFKNFRFIKIVRMAKTASELFIHKYISKNFKTRYHSLFSLFLRFLLN